MKSENKNTSIKLVSSNCLIRVGNSIEVTNRILNDHKYRELGKIHFKGNLMNEFNDIGSIRSISAVNTQEFQIATSEESSLFEYDVNVNSINHRIKFNGYIEYVDFDTVINNIAIASGKNIYITQNISGKIIRILEGHTREINILLFSKDGKRLFSGSSDKTIRVWETEYWQCVSILEGHEWLVNSLKITSDNKVLYSGGWDSFIIKWDLQTLKELERFNSGNVGGIKCLELSKDDNQIITGSGEKVIRIFNSINFKVVAEFKGHTDFVSCLCVSNDNKLLASGGWDGRILIWHFTEQELINSWQAHTGRINSIKFSNDNNYLLSGCSDKIIKCWK